MSVVHGRVGKALLMTGLCDAVSCGKSGRTRSGCPSLPIARPDCLPSAARHRRRLPCRRCPQLTAARTHHHSQHVHCTACSANLSVLLSLPEILVTARAAKVLEGMLRCGRRAMGGNGEGVRERTDSMCSFASACLPACQLVYLSTYVRGHQAPKLRHACVCALLKLRQQIQQPTATT